SDGFKEKEIKNINYHKEYTLGIYPDYHPHFTGKKDFKVSENFPKADETIDFDNAEDYNFSTSYRQLVSSNFDKKISEEYEKEVGEEYNEEKVIEIISRNLKTIKSSNIKNDLARNLTYYINPSNSKSEKLYNDL